MDTAAEMDVSDPMELLVVQRQEKKEIFTRYRLQETLMLMGCRPKDAVIVTKEVFVTFRKYLSKQPTTPAAVVTEETSKEGTTETNHDVDVSTIVPLPWHFLHQCIYASLTRLDYTKPHNLLDFQVAKEITQRNQSFVVLLGGTSGTGKSTLASLLAARLRLTTVLPTDSVRHILRAFTSKEENPCAFVSTYQAGDALSEEVIKELSIANDGPMSANRLHKRKILRGYKLQSQVVLEKLDRVLTMFEKRQQSLVVEGVHLNTDQMMELVKRHPNCVPFVIYISNELKHRERFAVRARHMTIDPQENKYIKYFDNIRIIQKHLCKHADKFLIPKIDNTNVDRSIATIQSTLVRVLRKMDRGEKIFDDKFNKMVLLSREHENAIKKAWSSKGVRKAMRPLIKQKVSKRLLLRRLLAEQTYGIVGASQHEDDDSSSSDEEKQKTKKHEQGQEEEEEEEDDEEEDDEDEQTTVVGSLFSTATRDVDSSNKLILPDDFLDQTYEPDEENSHTAVGSAEKMMQSLSNAIQQAALWRASQPLSKCDLSTLPPAPAPTNPNVTFSDMFELGPLDKQGKGKWKLRERRRSWMAGDLEEQIAKMQLPPLSSGAQSVGRHVSKSQQRTNGGGGGGGSGGIASGTSRRGFHVVFRDVGSIEGEEQEDSRRRGSSSGTAKSKFDARRVHSLPPEAYDFSISDYDIDSVSMNGDMNEDRLSMSSSQRDECISPLDHSMDEDNDSHFDVSPHGSDEEIEDQQEAEAQAEAQEQAQAEEEEEQQQQQ